MIEAPRFSIFEEILANWDGGCWGNLYLSGLEYSKAKESFQERRPNESPTQEQVYAEHLVNGGGIIFIDVETGDKFVLTGKKLMDAYRESSISLEDADSVDCDTIIQMALFGEIIYN